MVICVTKIFWEEVEMSNKLIGKDLGKKKSLYLFYVTSPRPGFCFKGDMEKKVYNL